MGAQPDAVDSVLIAAVAGEGLAGPTYGGASFAILDATQSLSLNAEASASVQAGGAANSMPSHRYLFSDGSANYFRVLPVQQMQSEALAQVLQSRTAYKKALFARAITALENDPTLPDLPACGAGAVPGGGCLLTGPSGPTTRPGAEQLQVRTARGAVPQIQRKLAVVIGLNQYDDKRIPQLINAVPDAREIGASLRENLGYDVVRLDNPTKAQIFEALNRVVEQARQDDSVMVYFAGHGELVDKTGLGYWIPRDANAEDPRGWISNADINRLLTSARSRQMAVVADSCYSGVFAQGKALEGTRASARLDDYLTRRAVTVMSSGSDEPVADSGKDGHSVFAWNLLQQLGQLSGWQAGSTVFDSVRIAVERELPQTPQYGASVVAGHEDGADFLFERREHNPR